MSEKAHLNAVLAAMTAAGAQPYTLQQLKDAATLPAYYNEVHVTQRAGTGPRSVGGPPQTSQWRILTRAVAQRYGNAQEMRDRARIALHEATLTVGTETYFVERAASDDPIAEDDGWFSGTSEFTY